MFKRLSYSALLLLLAPSLLWAAALVIPDRSTELRDMPAAVCTGQYLKGSSGAYICADAVGAETDPVFGSSPAAGITTQQVTDLHAPGSDNELTADELGAIQGANTPSALNPFLTNNDLDTHEEDMYLHVYKSPVQGVPPNLISAITDNVENPGVGDLMYKHLLYPQPVMPPNMGPMVTIDAESGNSPPFVFVYNVDQYTNLLVKISGTYIYDPFNQTIVVDTYADIPDEFGIYLAQNEGTGGIWYATVPPGQIAKFTQVTGQYNITFMETQMFDVLNFHAPGSDNQDLSDYAVKNNSLLTGTTQLQLLKFDFVTAPASAPTVALGASGVLNGNYHYAVSYVTSDGETELSPVSALISPSSQKVELTGIPYSADSRVTSRKIYRTLVGGPYYYFLTTINDNTTTVYTDNSLDGALGTDNATYRTNTTSGRIKAGNNYLGYLSPNNGANVAFGLDSMNSGTTGYQNVSIGWLSMYDATSGYSNSAVGSKALTHLLDGYSNSAFGQYAGYSSNGIQNTYVGFQSGFGESGQRFVSYFNTALGAFSGELLQTGSGNTLLGYRVGDNLTTGNYNILIGYDLNATASNTDYSLNIGNAIKGNLQTGAVTVTGTLEASNLSGTNTGDQDVSGKANLAGILGGQTLKGGTGASETLTLMSTNHATKGKILFGTSAYDEVNNWLSIGTTSPTSQLTQQSTAALESAPLGSELTDANNWTSTGWTGDYATGFTHTAGNTTALSRTMTNTIGQLYQVTFTISGRTAGNVTVTLGGALSPQSFSANQVHTYGPKTISTNGPLIFTPSSTFDGKISVISVKQITGTYSPLYAILDNGGISNFEIRSSLNTLYNTFVGRGAGKYNTTGGFNSAQGYGALQNNTTGYNNAVQGYAALYNNTTGYYNTAQGMNSLFSNTTGYSNAAQGMNSLFSNTTGHSNAAQGGASLYYNTTGYNNAVQGYAALYNNTTGYNNSAQGGYSLYNNTTGYYNAAQGGSSLYYNTTGYYNSAQGYTALYNSGKTMTAGSFIVGVAYTIISAGTTDFTLIGAANSTPGTVFTATGVGTGTGTAAANSNYNTAVGANAGRYITGGATALNASLNSVFLGAETRASADGSSNEIVIGSQATGAGSNTAVLGNDSITKTILKGTVTSAKYALSALNTAPSSASDTGTLGEIRITAGYIYVCTATNTWVRAALATW